MTNKQGMMDKAELIIRTQMAKHLLPEDEIELEPRTAFALSNARVIKLPDTEPIPDSILAQISDEKHQQRKSQVDEPLLILASESGSSLLVELDKMLLSPSLEVRRAVVSEIDRKIKAEPSFCTTKVQRTIEDLRNDVLSTNEDLYKPACVQIHDALSTDIFYGLSVLAHAGRLGAIDRVHVYLDRILRPARSSYEFVAELCLSKSMQNEEPLSKQLEFAAKESATVQDYLNEYFRICGFVPLGKSLSCSAILSSWCEATGNKEVDWEQLEAWASQHDSALAIYHVCDAVIGNHELIKSDEEREAFNHHVQVILEAGHEEERLNCWTLRQSLARVYCQDLMCEFPQAETERICIAAWWLADKIASAIEGSNKSCREYSIGRIEEVRNANEELWVLVQPAASPSALFSATMQFKSLWAESMLGLLIGQLVNDGKTLVSGPAAGSLLLKACGGAMCAHIELVDYYPYAFAVDTAPFIANVAEVVGDAELADKMRAVHDIASIVRSEEELENRLQNLANESEDVIRAVTFTIIKGAYAGAERTDLLWNYVANADWFHLVIGSIDSDAICRLCEASIRYQVTSLDYERRIQLPHIFAIAATKCSKDDPLLPVLTSYCIVSSIAAGTTSAISRLATECTTSVITDKLQDWHSRIDAIIRFARPLAAANLRPVKQVLARKYSNS